MSPADELWFLQYQLNMLPHRIASFSPSAKSHYPCSTADSKSLRFSYLIHKICSLLCFVFKLSESKKQLAESGSVSSHHKSLLE